MSVPHSAFSLTALSILAFTGFKLTNGAPGPAPTPVPVLVEAPAEAEAAVAQTVAPVVERVVSHAIAGGETFGGILSRYGVSGVTAIVSAAALLFLFALLCRTVPAQGYIYTHCRNNPGPGALRVGPRRVHERMHPPVAPLSPSARHSGVGPAK